MDAVFAHADHILVLVRGQIIARGSAARCGPMRGCAEVYLRWHADLTASGAQRGGAIA